MLVRGVCSFTLFIGRILFFYFKQSVGQTCLKVSFLHCSFNLPTVRLCRKMLTKDKKPDEKDGGKEVVQVVPPRPDTPEMFKAALKVAEQAGIEGTFVKLKKAYRQSEAAAEVRWRSRVSFCFQSLC